MIIQAGRNIAVRPVPLFTGCAVGCMWRRVRGVLIVVGLVLLWLAIGVAAIIVMALCNVIYL